MNTKLGNYTSSTPFNLAVPPSNIRLKVLRDENLNEKLKNYTSSTPFNLAVPLTNMRLEP